MAGLPYVGSGVLASALAMDKAVMKVVLAAAGLPVTPYAVVLPGEEPSPADAERLGLPLFVKPARAGSSLGISKVRDLADLPAALAHAREHDPKVLVEAMVVGREVECGVLGGLGGAAPQASVPAEIEVTGGQDFYDFEAKYLDADHPHRAGRPAGRRRPQRCRPRSVRAFRALGCAGLARVDFFVLADGTAAGQRGEHDAGVHARVDVPADVGGHRGGLPGAGRPAARRWRSRPAPACAELWPGGGSGLIGPRGGGRVAPGPAGSGSGLTATRRQRGLHRARKLDQQRALVGDGGRRMRDLEPDGAVHRRPDHRRRRRSVREPEHVVDAERLDPRG